MRAVILVLLVAGIIMLAMGLYIHHLRKTLRGIDNPLIFLSGKERSAHARELLEREQELYDAQHQEKLNQIIWNREVGDK
jgi:hypothetical protein